LNSRSLPDLKNRSEKATGRGQILTILKANSRSIARKSGEICTVQTLLQPISFKSDRLLALQVQTTMLVATEKLVFRKNAFAFRQMHAAMGAAHHIFAFDRRRLFLSLFLPPF
jgi:predicted transposase YdaD